MSRKTSEELELIKDKYNIDALWSWSRYSKYDTSKYEYFLKYILKINEDRADSIYTFLGTLAHEILEKLYLKEIKYEDMYNMFQDGFYSLRLADLKFDRNNEEKDKKYAEKYEDNMKHFFKNHKFLDKKVDIERFITIKVGEYVFQGYIDLVYKDDDGNFVIQDQKTSSIYKGEKIKKESGQLVLYSEGLRQLGVPLDKIKICWNFLKYCKVATEQANGKIAEREIERVKIGESLKANAKMWLKKSGYSEEEINNYLDLLCLTNSIECLPEDVKSKYVMDDCIVYIPLDESIIDELKNNIVNTLDEIVELTKEYNETKDDKLFWEEIDDKDTYYYATLCGYSGLLHKPYGKWLDEYNEKIKNKDNLFGGVGSDVGGGIGSRIQEHDLSWLEN